MNNIRKFKKVILTILLLGSLSASVLCRMGWAAPTASINVLITVDQISVSVASSTWNIGQIPASTIIISSAIKVTNTGNRQIGYSLNLTYGGGWSVSSDETPNANEFALLAIFSDNGVSGISNSDFSANDVIPNGVPILSNADNFAISSDDPVEKGFDVPMDEERNLHLNFRSPTSNTEANQQSITITVTANAG